MQILRLLLYALIVAWGCAAPSFGAEWKDKADAEGKLVFYSTSNTADAKAVTDGFKRLYPKIDVREASLVDEGTVITGGGVSLCIDAMLHLLKRLYGQQVASETARILEYQRAWKANLEQFPPIQPQATE